MLVRFYFVKFIHVNNTLTLVFKLLFIIFVIPAPLASYLMDGHGGLSPNDRLESAYMTAGFFLWPSPQTCFSTFSFSRLAMCR